MTLTNLIIWVLVGVATAFILLLTQQWSVNMLNPKKVHLSIGVIIGGSILRWLLISTVFIISLSISYYATFSIFFTFMIVRALFLLKWQGWLRINNTTIHHP